MPYTLNDHEAARLREAADQLRKASTSYLSRSGIAMVSDAIDAALDATGVPAAAAATRKAGRSC